MSTPIQETTSPPESPYRRRFDRQTRREALERRFKNSSRNQSKAVNSNTNTTAPSPEALSESQYSPAPTLTTAELESAEPASCSLVQRRAGAFGGTVKNARTAATRDLVEPPSLKSLQISGPKKVVAPVSHIPSEHDDEKKDFFSNGEVTVTTASSTTQPPPPPLDGYRALSDDRSSDQSSFREQHRKQTIDDDGDAHRDSFSSTNVSSENLFPTQPQHLEAKDGDVRYYRIVYRGVVALLSRPDTSSARSGAYLSYGEIVTSRLEFEIESSGSTVAFGNSGGGVSPQVMKATTTAGLPRSPMHLDTTLPPAQPPVASPPRSVFSQHSGSVSSLDTLRTTSTVAQHAQVENNLTKETTIPQHHGATTRKVIRVDEVLTGGYAADAADKERARRTNVMHTPKRSNMQHVPMVGPSPLPMADSVLFSLHSGSESMDASEGAESHNMIFSGEDGHFGFLFTQRKHVTIAEPIPEPQVCQSGQFLYKVTSSSPLPILTGPCMDAPRTKAMVLPGTIHEVCLRLVPTAGGDEVTFLRLSHRRGWIVDRMISHSGGGSALRVVPVMKDVTSGGGGGSACDESITSLPAMSVASSVVTPGSAVRRRHRPPRRKRDKAIVGAEKLPPASRQPGGNAVHLDPGSPARSRRNEPMKTPEKNKSPVPPERLLTPTSNVSMLSEESSLEHGVRADELMTRHREPTEPIVSSLPSLFLMRVTAPRGLKILDAPLFQVSNLIRGQQGPSKTSVSSHAVEAKSGTKPSPSKPTKSVFSHTSPSTRGSPAVFDGKSRTLPRGALFEALTRMEASGAFSIGAGLIKLSDNSGWAIVPRQDQLDAQYRNYHGGVKGVKEGEATRAYEEVGNAIVNLSDEQDWQNSDPSTPSLWVRVVARNGILVSCPPPTPSFANDEDTSPTSSAGGSSILSGGGSNANFGVLTQNDSDVASSVGSAFLDAMFRTPKKKDPEKEKEKDYETRRDIDKTKRSADAKMLANIIPCGMCVEVNRSIEQSGVGQKYVRLCQGQGWIPLQISGKSCVALVEKPDIRCGSFWFRVQQQRGIKVRLGPSRRAASIKSEDGVYFRFECGEFLRACEVITIFDANGPVESFAKLYRNRHAQLLRHDQPGNRRLASLTTPAEWVQVHSGDQLYLVECGEAPYIQRHRQGWRYNVKLDSGIEVRKGPSFTAETTGMVLLGGESVLVNERVTAPNEQVTGWLRLKDGQGWVHDVGLNGEVLMIAHSLHHRMQGGLARPVKPTSRREDDEATYNTIIARLFHGDISETEEGMHHSNNND